MATWPSTLPQEFHQNGFSIKPPVGAIRTSMSTGKAFQRRRYTAAVQPISGRMWLTADQYSTLIAFWENTLAMGSLEFDWVHPITGDAATFRFPADKPPTISVVDGEVYGVNMQLEIVP